MCQKKKNKLKAFTLQELLVVLVISSLLVLLAFQVLTYVNKAVYMHQDRREKVLSQQRLIAALNKDFQLSKQVRYTGLYLEADYETHHVSYEMQSDYILRRHGHRQDTFFCSVVEQEVYWQGEPGSGPKDHIDALTMKVEVEKTELSYAFSKWYSAGDLLRLMEENGKKSDLSVF